MQRPGSALLQLLILVALGAAGAVAAEPAPKDDSPLAPGLAYVDDITIAGPHDFLRDTPALNADGLANFFTEIPTGTNAKWEVKEDGKLHWDHKHGKPRVVQYLSYVGNYGIVPQTVQGDGDPIDILVLAPPLARGEVLPVRIIGVAQFADDGEQDNKLIAVAPGMPLGEVTSLESLEEAYPGVTDIVRIWFEHYKGKDNKMHFGGYAGADTALALLREAHESFLAREAGGSR